MAKHIAHNDGDTGSNPVVVTFVLNHDIIYGMTQKHKEDILRLRAEGKSYREIEKELGCSRGTIAYHCGEGQKEKTIERTRHRRERDTIYRKIESFKANREFQGRVTSVKDPEASIRSKVRDFQKRGQVIEEKFSTKEFMEEFSETDQCYLTGRKIDLADPLSYQLDHIVPKSKGGANTIDNCALATREANFAKGDLPIEEYLLLCFDSLVHWGIIEKD